jgi:hypothetical protein
MGWCASPVQRAVETVWTLRVPGNVAYQTSKCKARGDGWKHCRAPTRLMLLSLVNCSFLPIPMSYQCEDVYVKDVVARLLVSGENDRAMHPSACQ